MFEAAVLGVSAGGLHATQAIIAALPAAFRLPIVIVQHLGAQSDAYLVEHLNRFSAIKVKEAEDKEIISPSTVYVAPAGYHLLIEPDKSFSLSVDDKVNFSRPSIDLLFESAANAFGDSLIGIVLTGANADGAQGLQTIKRCGGLAVVQDPDTAEAPYMPRAALAATQVDHILDLERIALLLRKLSNGGSGGTRMEG